MQSGNLAGLLTLLHGLPGYTAVLTGLRAAGQDGGPIQRAVGLIEAVRPFITAGVHRDLERPVLVVAPGAERAQEYYEQLQAWSPHADQVLLFPSYPHLPYQRVAWDQQTLAQRLRVLARLYFYQETAPPPLIVASARSLLHRTLPPWDFEAEVQVLERGKSVAMAELVRGFYRLGYRPASVVDQPGEFSRRGGIVDVFPPADERPLRIEFFGDVIDSLRRFDLDTQRTEETVSTATVTPAHEALPLRGPLVAQELQEADLPSMHPLAQNEFERALEYLAAGDAFPMLGLFQPLLHPEAATLLDYFPTAGRIIVDDWGQLDAVAGQLGQQANTQRDEQEAAREIPKGFEAHPYAAWARVRDWLVEREPLVLAYDHWLPDAVLEDPHPLATHFTGSPRYGGQLKEVVADTVDMMGEGYGIVAVTRQAPRLAELYADWGIEAQPVQAVESPPKPGSIVLVHGPLSEGWLLKAGGDAHRTPVALLTDGELFGWRIPKRRRQPRRRKDTAEAFFSDVNVGDYVVHIEHGIAIYRGLVKMDVGDSQREYLVLEYAKDDKLYVPTYQVDRIARYVGVGDQAPKVTRLGTADWERVKERTKKSVEDLAREILELYARREVAEGYAFSPDTSWQIALETAFPHVETEDQIDAIEDIKRDMESERPMDRLLVGDVGFGKTEVAIRAAFKAVMDGKQVAVLVPTTVLAQQHYNTFSERLQPFPIQIEMLSRFRKSAEQAVILERLASGEVDIVVGTHRLIQKDVVFKDLGLLIIDEEHRFGVKDKERLKKMRAAIDVLSMTATPIPRTLHMSLTGIRDMSTIDTPPDERLPITTQVMEWDDEVIRRAILRELSRGGQTYFVHNRVATIEYTSERLRRLVPEADIAVGHGQMSEDRLAETMLAFAAGEIDVLVCTSIIESGLDIPNANTLIVDRADMFGLAQLYQLRGRVGRGAQRAYAFFLYDRHAELPEDARQRLQSLMEATDLGAGFRIAMRDLEIRGAGDLLGARQHGHISAVGFDLYTRLLAQAIKELQADRPAEADGTPSQDLSLDAESSLLPTIDLPIDAFLPEEYIPEERIRLRLYRRMAEVSTRDDVKSMEQELRDRFGDLPTEVENLIFLLRLKVLASEAGAEYVTREGKTIVIKLADAGPQQRAAILRRFDGRLRVGRDQVWMPVEERNGQWRRALERALEDLARIQ
jgi:transcription-repair coupling factor (superfamily II helicase)